MILSIIVTIFNIENYLRECLDSIIEVACDNIEIILIDDGSIDNSSLICDEYSKKDCRIRVVHKSNGGLSDARNKGIDLSKGKYIMFVDGDDKLIANSLYSIIDILNKRQDLDIILGRMINYYEDSNEYIEDKYDFFNKEDTVEDGKACLVYMFNELYGQLWSAVRSVYKREIFVKSKIIFEKGIVSEDLECIPKVFLNATKVGFYNTPFYIYRRNREGSIITTINRKKYDDLYYVIKKWCYNLERMNLNSELIIGFYAQLGEVISAYLVGINCLSNRDKEEIVNKYKELIYLLKYTKKKSTKLKYFIIRLFGITLGIKILYKISILKNKL